MALRASAHNVVVNPTGDNTQSEHGALIVVANNAPSEKIWRGVVLDVGVHVATPLQVGNLVHYTGCDEIFGKHLVPEQYVIAYEDDE